MCQILPTDGIFYSFMKRAVKDNLAIASFFELTPDCNAFCPFCLRPPTDRLQKTVKLTLSQVQRALDELWDLGGFFVGLTGGEPLLHPQFDDIVAYARRLGFAVSVTTNGFLLDSERIAKLTDLGLYNFVISLHSVRDETYQKMFNVRRSVQSVLHAIEDLKAKGNNVTISFVATKLNINEFKEVKTRMMGLGLKNYEVSPNIMHERSDGNLLNPLRPSDEQVKRLFLENPEYIAIRTRRTNNLTCVAGRALLSVDYLGDVHPCPIFELPVGNIEKKTITEIWNQSPLLSNLRSIHDGQFSLCQHCPALKHCSVCIARNYSCHKDYFQLSEMNCREAHLCTDAETLLLETKASNAVPC